MPEIPAPVRAALGLVATAVDRLKALPEQAPDLPVQVISNAMQLSMRAQQRYAELTTRGDEVLADLRGGSDDAPSWATFDEEVDADEAAGTARRLGADAVAPVDLDPADLEPARPDPDAPVPVATPRPAAPTAPQKRAAKKAAAKAAKKAPAESVAPRPAGKKAAKKVARKVARGGPDGLPLSAFDLADEPAVTGSTVPDPSAPLPPRPEPPLPGSSLPELPELPGVAEDRPPSID